MTTTPQKPPKHQMRNSLIETSFGKAKKKNDKAAADLLRASVKMHGAQTTTARSRKERRNGGRKAFSLAKIDTKDFDCEGDLRIQDNTVSSECSSSDN